MQHMLEHQEGDEKEQKNKLARMKKKKPEKRRI
jgi:hypothetical protein